MPCEDKDKDKDEWNTQQNHPAAVRKTGNTLSAGDGTKNVRLSTGCQHLSLIDLSRRMQAHEIMQPAFTYSIVGWLQ